MDDAFRQQVLDDTLDWLDKAVIGLNLCPFAKSVRVKGQVRTVVSEATTAEALREVLVAELRHLAEVDPEVTDTTLLVHPLGDEEDAKRYVADLVELVFLRVSLINGCAYCIDKHSRDLLSGGMPVDKLVLVPVWHEAGPLFTLREQAALAWADFRSAKA